MRLVVTGGAGFLGSHFIRSWLAWQPDGQVTNVDALTYAGSPARLADVARSARYRFCQADVSDGQAIGPLLEGCDTVVHFAAETHVDRSIVDAAPFLRTNIEGTYVLLQQARAHGVKRFIHISTDEVYGPVLSGAVDERAPLSPRSPYAASKAAADLLVQAYRDTYGLPAIVVRPTNIFGPWQLPEKFIPLCITNGCEGLPVPIYGDGQQRRAWLHVSDFCEALRVILECGAIGLIYNVGSGREQPNLEVARAVLTALDRPAELLQFVADRPGHDRRYAMDDANARALGWQPRLSFEQGLRETMDWYRGHTEWWSPLAQQLRQDPDHWLDRAARAGARAPSRADR